tara:strand:- start:879 stop:1376 length:498 start_codon:yes stop_codon:yes gene_type:complete
MKINIKDIVLIFFISILLSNCSQKNNNIDLDLSNLPKPKINDKDVQLGKNIENENNELFIRDLISFETKEKILSKFKIGKKDPFSAGGVQQNKFSSDFKFKGFLNTKMEKFVFVSYQGNEGTISEDSIGGLNTKFLPDGAKVIDINTKIRQLKISFDNEEYIFEL